MIIDVTGFGWSGSGAVIDMLREYDDLQFPAMHLELSILHCVDGIKDLEYKIVKKNCRLYDAPVAINRFLHLTKYLSKTLYKKPFCGNFYRLSEEYINDLGGRDIIARSFFDNIYSYWYDKPAYYYNRFFEKANKTTIGSFLLKRIYKNIKIKRIQKKRVVKDADNFYPTTQAFIGKLLSYLRADDKPIVLDHFFSPDCPYLFRNLVEEEVKCIVVYRDPRDTYILAKETLMGDSTVPVKSLDEFVWFYKNTIAEYISDSDNHILYVRFEDLIYNYESTKKRIEKFLSISSHRYPLRQFNPYVSINNTQLWKKLRQYKEDIAIIEKELKSYLFDYDSYAISPNWNTETF